VILYLKTKKSELSFFFLNEGQKTKGFASKLSKFCHYYAGLSYIYSITYLLVSKAIKKFAKPSVIFSFPFSLGEIAKSVLACKYNNNCNFLHTLVPNVKRTVGKQRKRVRRDTVTRGIFFIKVSTFKSILSVFVLIIFKVIQKLFNYQLSISISIIQLLTFYLLL